MAIALALFCRPLGCKPNRAAQDTSVSLEGLTEYMQLHAKQLCEALEVPYGSLIRTALAIKRLDGAERLQSEHLQEAAQHLIIKEG